MDIHILIQRISPKFWLCTVWQGPKGNIVYRGGLGFYENETGGCGDKESILVVFKGGNCFS